MIKQRLLFTIALLLASLISYAQAPIIVSDQNGNIWEVGLPSDCSKRLIVNAINSLSDITLHPNGKMYATRFSAQLLIEVDTITGDKTEIIDFEDIDANPVGMTASSDGKIYVTESGVASRLFEVDVTNNTFINKGVLADGSAGDLSWSNGLLYNASANNKLVRVNIDNPAASEVIGDFIMPQQIEDEVIFSLVTAVITCDSSITYGITDQTNQYFIIDLSNAALTPLCNDTDSPRIFGATSRDEFRASETCSITLDLDNDNSSGATGNNFSDDFDCATSNANIADIDVNIESPEDPVDSIVVTLSSGILDGVDEFLQLGSTPNINANNNSTSISAINNGSATIENFEIFLNTLTYINTSTPPTPGNRMVEVIAYSNNESSNVATATISFLEVVDAGNNGSITLCSDDDPTNLFNSLGGNPFSGGIWSPLLTSGTNIFDPSDDAEGTYTYIVSNSCSIDSADVMVSIDDAVNAGGDTSLTLCSTDNSIDLFTILSGTPTSGGTWTPSLNNGTGVFNPATDAADTYTYTVIGCNTDNASVIITIEDFPNAGTNGTLNICTEDAPVNLLNTLGGDPATNGTWSPILFSGNNIFNPSEDAAGTYTYTVSGCDTTVSAEVIVSIGETPNAGTNGNLTICINDDPVNLLNSLGGMPNNGGTWSPSLNSGTNSFNPSEDAQGVYTYTVSSCDTTVSAQVDVTIEEIPNAGTGGSLSLCTSDSPVNLLSSLGGSPDEGGTWSPTLNSGTNTFDPNEDAQGIYTYTVSRCDTIVSAQVNISIEEAPNAGSNGSITIIETDEPFNLIDILNSNPDNGGVWTPALNSAGNIFTPGIDAPGSYTYTISNDCGSESAIATVIIEEVEDSCLFESLFVPNAFTPNNDGLNDILLVRYVGNYDTFTFSIYNRWGNLVFETDDIEKGWDGFFEGKLQSSDVFAYFLELKCNDQIEQRKGNITILR